jgi:hypothetical protein
VLVRQHTAEKHVLLKRRKRNQDCQSAKTFFKKRLTSPKTQCKRLFSGFKFFFKERRERHSSPQGPNCNSFLNKNATQRLSHMQHKGLGLKSQCVHFCFYFCSSQALTLCDTTQTLAFTLTFTIALPLPLPLSLPLPLPLPLPPLPLPFTFHVCQQ